MVQSASYSLWIGTATFHHVATFAIVKAAPESRLSAVAQTRTFRLAIRAPSNGHSLSAIFPVSPSPIGHFGKEQSGTDFGQAKPLGVRQRDRGGRFPPDVRLRDSVVSYTSLQTRLVPQKPRHTIRPKLSIFATRQCRLRAVTSILKAGVTAGHMPGR